MEKEFIPYEQALALKELGFDEPCIACYTPITWMKDKPYRLYGHFVNRFKEFFNSKLKQENVSAPLYQQAFRWFREKYKSNFIIGFGNDGGYYRIDNLFSKWYKTYEEAELECLKKLIEIVKNDNRTN